MIFLFLSISLFLSASDANRQQRNKEKRDVTFGGRLAQGDKRDGRGSRAEISPTRREERELGAEDEEAHQRESLWNIYYEAYLTAGDAFQVHFAVQNSYSFLFCFASFSSWM